MVSFLHQPFFKLKSICMKRFHSFKNFSALFLITASISFTACNNESTSTDTDDDSINMTAEDTTSNMQRAEAVLNGTKTDTTLSGTVRFESENNGQVKMMLDLTVAKKANSTVAVHIHEHGDCGDMGNNAHGHWNPTNENHGKWGEGNFHSGDIGNVTLDASGKGTLELTTDRWTIGGGDSTKNILNRAIIVHSGVDDFKTQPTGNAGSRIGCGLINQSN